MKTSTRYTCNTPFTCNTPLCNCNCCVARCKKSRMTLYFLQRCETSCLRVISPPISFPELRFPWPAVGKRELWEQPLWKNKGNNRILVIRLTAHLHLWRMPEMVAPRALVFGRLVKGNEALGTRLHPLCNLQRNFVRMDQSELIFRVRHLVCYCTRCKLLKHCKRVTPPLQLEGFFIRHRCVASCKKNCVV